MRPVLLSIFLSAAALVHAQLPEFSALSSRNVSKFELFHSLRVSDGILYFVSTAEYENMLYKVGFDGTLLDSVNLRQGDYKFWGYLTLKGDDILLVGEANKPLINYNQYFTEQRAVVVVLNGELDIQDVYLYDILPFAAGSSISIQTSPHVYIQPVTGIGVFGDTVLVTKDYTYFDTVNFIPLGSNRVIERMVINGDALPTVFISATSADAYTAVFTDTSIYVYGQSSECCGNVLIDPAAVGEYDHTGNFIQKHILLDSFLDFDPTWAAVGNRIGDRIYNSFTDEGFFGQPCNTAMLDIRDLDFQLLRNTEVPDCDMSPSGTKCVAMSNNSIYYLTLTSDYNLGLYKYDTLLNLIWGKIYDFEAPHYGISLNDTPDGGVILECGVSGIGNDFDILKLYKISPAGDIVSSTNLVVSPPKQAPVVYPNPFSTQVFLEGLPAQATTAQLYDPLGRLLYTVDTDGLSIDFPSSLKPGTYLLCLRKMGTGALLHSQWLVKK